jgi:hypothetical protein
VVATATRREGKIWAKPLEKWHREPRRDQLWSTALEQGEKRPGGVTAAARRHEPEFTVVSSGT